MDNLSNACESIAIFIVMLIVCCSFCLFNTDTTQLNPKETALESCIESANETCELPSIIKQEIKTPKTHLQNNLYDEVPVLNRSHPDMPMRASLIEEHQSSYPSSGPTIS